MLRLYVFSVGLGQCIFVCPDDKNYCALIDCGCDKEIVSFIEKHLPNNQSKRILKNLTLTNYDEDHFSGICELIKNVEIETVCFSKNLTSEEIEEFKDQKTEALKQILHIKDTYNRAVENWNPPYEKCVYSLNKGDLASWTTNNLSQMVFLRYKEFTVCIPGDLEQEGWKKILEKQEVQNLLKETKLFVASHHGREGGYYFDVFKYCKPQCIIISDDSVKHGTQENMSSVYAKHVDDDGICFYREKRKVLTTRNDGHLLIEIDDYGLATYSKLEI